MSKIPSLAGLFLKELTYLRAFFTNVSRGISPLQHLYIFPEPNIPSFQYSNILPPQRDERSELTCDPDKPQNLDNPYFIPQWRFQRSEISIEPIDCHFMVFSDS